MFCFPLSNWTTIRGATSVTAITQSEAQWLDLQAYEDIVAWLDCRNVTPGGATSIQISYQTCPTKDDSLYTALATTTLANTTITITPMLMSASGTPLARWLRWQLSVTGTPTSAWDATFRVWIAANIGPHKLRAKAPSPASVRMNRKACNGDCTGGGTAPLAPSLLVGQSTTSSRLATLGAAARRNP